MSFSREESPDWLHHFQAPTSAVTLLSGSESSPNDSPTREDNSDPEKPSLKEASDQDTVFHEGGEKSPSDKTSKAKSPNKKLKVKHSYTRKNKIVNRGKRGNVGDGKVANQETSEENIDPRAPNHSVWALSSDSESCPDNGLKPEKEGDKNALFIDSGGESPFSEASKRKSPRKRLKTEDQTPTKKKILNPQTSRKGIDGDIEVAEEEISEKHIEPHFSSSRLPLVLSEKVHRSKALVECEGESIDLSGDMGSVGRLVISDNPTVNDEMFIDLKGTIYKTTIVPSRTFCVVSLGQAEAKIEAIMNDFIQLKPQSNVYEAETMVEGTLDGFSFDSEDEAEKMPKAISGQTDQNEGTEEQPNGKTKAKAGKTSGAARKKGKTAAGGKRPKNTKKKTQAPKKTKAKK
ncbi:DNA-binding protein BIN4 [Cornus florida]|uniref:DNA-binding protein BIN4 n=1 Tax=Cornus florida TaxID=4283 RepID=UPI002897C4EF|nr:DNA-binding protein BIN4 [Cornus florida]